MRFPKKLYVKTYQTCAGELEFIRILNKDDPYYAIYLNKILHQPVRIFNEIKTDPHEFRTDDGKFCYKEEKECLEAIKLGLECRVKTVNIHLKKFNIEKEA